MNINRTSIEDIKGMSTRAINCLRFEGVEYVDQLSGMKGVDLLMIPNLGKKTYAEILDALCSAGFRIPMNKRTNFDFAN